jgi:GNAT superfamily N-acetyltransferase
VPSIRRATNADSAGIIALIEPIYGEFPGVVMDLDGVDAELRAPEGYDAFWVAEQEGRIVATGACSLEDGFVEIKKMYVAREHRGTGLGGRLLDKAESVGRDAGRARAELWSDTRFAGAHAFYERRGYVRQPETRHLNDPSDTTEYHFVKLFKNSP